MLLWLRKNGLTSLICKEVRSFQGSLGKTVFVRTPFLRNTPSTAGNSITGSERPSSEPFLKKEASPAVLGGRSFWKGSGSLKCLEFLCLGHPSRTLDGNSRKCAESVSGVFPEFFWNFFQKVSAVLGVRTPFPRHPRNSSLAWRKTSGCFQFAPDFGLEMLNQTLGTFTPSESGQKLRL